MQNHWHSETKRKGVFIRLLGGCCRIFGCGSLSATCAAGSTSLLLCLSSRARHWIPRKLPSLKPTSSWFLMHACGHCRACLDLRRAAGLFIPSLWEQHEATRSLQYVSLSVGAGNLPIGNVINAGVRYQTEE